MTEQTSPEPAEGTVSPAGTNDSTYEVVPDEPTTESDSDAPVYAEPLPVDASAMPADVDVDYDEEDVKMTLERETVDGPGFADVHELPAPDGDDTEDDQL